MKGISTSQLLIYIVGIGVVLFILGMVNTKHISFDDNPFTTENFKNSTLEDIEAGASQFYDWGYTPLKSDKKSNSRHRKRRCPSCDHIYIDQIDIINTATDNVCKNCDITLNKDIDKYVLKSSIPPCPDMSQYALKNQLPPAGFNPDEWIRKSEIPPCPICPDLKDYILKSEVPACDAEKICPKCPECPVCPTCPPCSPKIKVVEKIVYRDRPRVNPYANPLDRSLPQSLGEHYPQSGAIWRPKLSNSNSGFIPPDVPMAGNAWMARRGQELASLPK